MRWLASPRSPACSLPRSSPRTSLDRCRRRQLPTALCALSQGAQADTKPELQIFADDVKCAHGATVGDLDKGALFYLQSRGIPTDEATALLIEAFIAEIFDDLPDGAVGDHIADAVAAWMEEKA